MAWLWEESFGVAFAGSAIASWKRFVHCRDGVPSAASAVLLGPRMDKTYASPSFSFTACCCLNVLVLVVSWTLILAAACMRCADGDGPLPSMLVTVSLLTGCTWLSFEVLKLTTARVTDLAATTTAATSERSG
jgi:hypothetical protein